MTAPSDLELLELHRRLVSIRSTSGEEAEIADFVERYLAARDCLVERVGHSVLAFPRPITGGPLLVLDSHLDTVPPATGWTRDPWTPSVEEARVYGLGSNDAKASVAAMIAGALRARESAPGVRVGLLFAAEEETSNRGSAELLGRLRERGLEPSAALIGEPTALDLAVAQKGLMVLELLARGSAVHAAHRRALGSANPIFDLARDLAALESLDLGAPDPRLGPITMEATVIQGGAARNAIPAEARCILDLRTNPEPPPSTILERVRAVVKSEVLCRSDRLRPSAVDLDARIVQAARAARPEAACYGSNTLSDMVVFGDIPSLKVGPGESRRSHTADEFVLESEIVEGARFYERVIQAFQALGSGKETVGATLGSR